MTRQGRTSKRTQVRGDARLAKFINLLMRDGKKSLAERIVYDALDAIAARMKDDPLKVWERAINNVRPRVEVRSRRVGGATYQVPHEVHGTRSTALAMRWLVRCARERSEHGMVQRLAAEIIEAAQNRGNAVKKREDVHKMADANKAFGHYQW